MKSAIIGMAALALTATAVSAAPNRHAHHDGFRGKHVSGYQNVQVRQKMAHLSWVKRQAWADGRLTFRERIKIRRAERQLARAFRSVHRY